MTMPAGARETQIALATLRRACGTGSGGCVVTEWPPGFGARRMSFIARCRLIAALSSGIVITEAIEPAGFLRVPHDARQLGRAVMAVPGPAGSPHSRGCHRLIRDGATPVTSAADVRAAVAAHCRRTGSGHFGHEREVG